MVRTESSAVWIGLKWPATGSRLELVDVELTDLALAYGPLMPLDCWAPSSAHIGGASPIGFHSDDACEPRSGADAAVACHVV